jgi:Cysteine dioxygenase type I
VSGTVDQHPSPRDSSGLPDLHGPTPQRLGLLARRLARRPDRWFDRLRFDTRRRHYTRISSTPTYEAWLLTWLPGQATRLHDHGGSSGAFVVVEGALRERTVTCGALGRASATERVLASGRMRSFGPDHVHDVSGLSPRAVSLRVYGPALATMHRYRLVEERLVLVASESAGSDW